MKPCATNVACAALLLVALPAAQGRRLSSALPPALVGDVRKALVSPDGGRVVFTADAEEDERVDLYSAPSGGGAAVRLNPTLASGDVTADFLVSADSARVVYRADQDADEVFELWVVPIDGGPTTKLSGALAPGADVAAGLLSSASSGRVVYRTTGGGGFDHLWSVPSDGSAAPVQLDAGASFEGVEPDFALSSDGLSVAFRADAGPGSRIELWIVPIDGSVAPQSRSAPGVSSIRDFAFAPGDGHLVFRADHSARIHALYSVPVAGGSVTKLFPPVATSTETVSAYVVAPDGARVAYTRFEVELGQPRGLHSVPIGGGAATQLDASALGENMVVGGAAPYRVLYLDDADTDGWLDLHTVPLEGGASSELAFPGMAAQAEPEGLALSPDGARVVYRAIDTQLGSLPRALLSAPVAGGTVVRLDAPAFADATVSSFEIAPDSESVLYVADQAEPSVRELWSAPIAGGTTTRLNAELTWDGDLESAQLDPSGSRAVYLADQDTNDALELYSVATSGGAVAKLSPTLVTVGTAGDVLSFELRPDGGRAVYLADQWVDDELELFRVDTAGGAPVRVSGALAPGGDVASFDVAPDWTRVVYRADPDVDGEHRLCSAPLDGGAAVTLDAGPVAEGDVEDFLVGADSARVVYRADQDVDQELELFSVPIAGGAVVQLNPALVAGGDVPAGRYRVSPDSSRVVYMADQDADDVNELWSVPIAGGAAVRLNAALPAGGDVIGFEIAADSSRVAYLADQDADERYELWSAPLAGGTPVRLNATLALGGDVTSYALAADASRAVYRADQDLNERYELFSVPLAGGAAVKLNGTLVTGGDVLGDESAFAISADSSRVLYLADQAVDGVDELYLVALGGGPSVRRSGALAAGGDVLAFRIAPSSTRAVYRADQDTDGVFELYGVGLASGAITRLHAPLAAGASTPSSGWLVTPDSLHVVVACDLVADGDVRLWALSFSGAGPQSLSGPLAGDDVESFDVRARRAVYVASQAQAFVYELFEASLPGPLRGGSVSPGR